MTTHEDLAGLFDAVIAGDATATGPLADALRDSLRDEEADELLVGSGVVMRHAVAARRPLCLSCGNRPRSSRSCQACSEARRADSHWCERCGYPGESWIEVGYVTSAPGGVGGDQHIYALLCRECAAEAE